MVKAFFWRMVALVQLMMIVLCANVYATTPEASVQGVIELQRKIVFLLLDEDVRDDVKQRDVFIARNYYFKKRDLLESLETRILGNGSDGSVPSARDRDDALHALTDILYADSTHAADMLAFVDLIDAIIYAHENMPFLSSRQLAQVKSVALDLEKITTAYDDKVQALYEKLGTRGKTLETWDAYVDFLKKQYDRSAIRREFNQSRSDLNASSSRGAGKKSSKDPNVLWGYGIPEKTVVLTFDDGPHYRFTDAILDILKNHGVHAYFFAVGKNFGTSDGEAIHLKKNADKLKRALDEGHKIGNHSFTHRVLTKLSDEERSQEIVTTNKLLAEVIGDDNTVFRPPYGSQDDGLKELTVSNGMRSVMWNIDSMDWGDPIPDSIVKRVMDNLEKKKHGIILFHDIHKQTVAALPALLDELKAQGYRFVDLDGNPFDEIPTKTEQTNTKKTEITSEKKSKVKDSQFYQNSWAVVVGINKYKEWPQLSYAVNDASAVRDVLINQYEFKKDNIITLLDEDATRDKITEVLGDTLANPKKVKPQDRVFVFYAGHGMTRKLPSGRDLGYIIPVDASLDKFHSRSLSMTHLRDFSEMIPAKHVYFVMDSCYSGIALTRSAGTVNNAYIDEITKRNARQILTAGGADQEVSDGGPGGHSIFTWTFLQGLKGAADLDNNKVITASELGAYVAPQVADNSSQTPVFGNLVGSEGGDFVFELATSDTEKSSVKQNTSDAVNANSDAARQLAALQKALAEANKRNQELEKKLIAASTTTALAEPSKENKTVIQTLSPRERKKLSLKKHQEGLDLYKAKKYSEALVQLKSAVELNPTNSTIVNNYGFVLYKAGKLDESLKWLEKTIELEPKRTVVYLNIADTLVELKRDKEALPYYAHYLTLYPSSPKADEVKEKMKMLSQ